MNVKTETVQFMAGSTLLDKIFHSVGGRIFIAALQTVLSSVVLLLTFLLRQFVEITLLKYVIVVAVGLIAGFSARRFLKGHTQILKLLTATLSAALSLMVLYTLSGGFLGINLFFGLNKTPDWHGLIQFVFAAFSAWLVLQAFRTVPGMEASPVPAPPPQISSSLSRPGIKQWLPKLKFASGKKISQKTSKVVLEKEKPLSAGKSNSRKGAPSLAIVKSPTKTSPPPKLVVAPVLKPEIKKPARPKTKRVKKKPPKEIKFIGVQEHNCPYCLDPVQTHDPRGVKICSVCKTHHHADCWGITGACQIPHAQK